VQTGGRARGSSGSVDSDQRRSGNELRYNQDRSGLELVITGGSMAGPSVRMPKMEILV
jgi:hypothetical protein